MKKLTIILTILLSLTLTGCKDKETQKEETKITYDQIQNVEITNDILLQEQTIDNIKIKDIKANIENNKTTITSNIENISEEEIYINKIKSIITYKENNQEKTIELETYIGTTLNKNETKEIKTIVDKDLKTTTKIEYQIIR